MCHNVSSCHASLCYLCAMHLCVATCWCSMVGDLRTESLNRHPAAAWKYCRASRSPTGTHGREIEPIWACILGIASSPTQDECVPEQCEPHSSVSSQLIRQCSLLLRIPVAVTRSGGTAMNKGFHTPYLTLDTHLTLDAYHHTSVLDGYYHTSRR